MISGAHVIVFSNDATADRAFFQEALGFSSVDAGRGWLIFALPPAELAVHPSGGDVRKELYLMCADMRAEVSALGEKGVRCSEVRDVPWGSVAWIPLPGGGQGGRYQPKHPSAVVLASS